MDRVDVVNGAETPMMEVVSLPCWLLFWSQLPRAGAKESISMSLAAVDSWSEYVLTDGDASPGNNRSCGRESMSSVRFREKDIEIGVVTSRG